MYYRYIVWSDFCFCLSTISAYYEWFHYNFSSNTLFLVFPYLVDIISRITLMPFLSFLFRASVRREQIRSGACERKHSLHWKLSHKNINYVMVWEIKLCRVSTCYEYLRKFLHLYIFCRFRRNTCSTAATSTGAAVLTTSFTATSICPIITGAPWK